MEQVTGPGADGLDATSVLEPNGAVNVRSWLAGWKIPRAPSQRVANAGFHVTP